MSSPAKRHTKVFISYSQESPAHRDRVYALTVRLMHDGIQCVSDHFFAHKAPPQGWLAWMDLEIQDADYVLIICTEAYRRRAERKEEPGKGLGAIRESTIINKLIYNQGGRNERFIPVILDEEAKTQIPEWLCEWNFYNADTEDGYDQLLRHLTDQPLYEEPELGEVPVLTPRVNLATSSTQESGPAQNSLFVAYDESLNLLKILVEGSPDAVYIKDIRGRYLFINDTFSYWTQRKTDSVVGKVDTEIFSSTLATKFSLFDQQVITTGQVHTEEIWLDDQTTDNSGTERCLVVTRVPLRNKNNQLIGILGTARDNTLRKLIEEEFREAKLFNEQIISQAREGIFVFDADLRYTVWNTFMEEFSGLALPKVLGRHALEGFSAIREQGMIELIKRALGGETTVSPDMLVNSGQGVKTSWVRCLFSPLRDLKDNIIGVLGLVSVITEYKKSEARLRRSQQFNQQVIANAGEGILVYDRDLRCMVWNPVIEDWSGFSADDILGRPILEIVPHWFDAGLGDMLHRVLQGDTVESQDFLVNPRADRWVVARYSPLFDANEQVLGVIGILTDVTFRRQAEAVLRESQWFNQHLLESLLEAIAVCDCKLNILVWNPAMEELTGLDSGRVLGTNILTACPYLHDADSPKFLKRALGGEAIRVHEICLQENIKWALASYSPLYNSPGDVAGVIISMRDVSSLKVAKTTSPL